MRSSLRDMGLSDLSDFEETGSGLSVSDEEEPLAHCQRLQAQSILKS